MSDQYKGGTIPKDLSPQLRQLLEDHDRALVRGIPRSNISPQVLPAPSGGTSKPRGPLPQISYQVSGVEGNVGTIPPQPFGSVVAWRFTGSPTLLTDSGNLYLNSDFSPDGPAATLTLVCNGVSWYELSRCMDTGYSLSGPVVLGCPTSIHQDVATCNPILAIYGFDTGVSPILDVSYNGTTVEEITQALHIFPLTHPETGRGLYNLGASNSPWKGIYSDSFYGRAINLQAGNVTISSSPQNDYNITAAAGAQFMIYRVTATVVVGITGFLAPTTGQLFDFVNVGAQPIGLLNLDSGSSSANQIITGTGASMPLAQNDTARLWYDLTSAKWRVLK